MNYSLHLSSRLTLILCTVGILPAMSQQQEKETATQHGCSKNDSI